MLVTVSGGRLHFGRRQRIAGWRDSLHCNRPRLIDIRSEFDAGDFDTANLHSNPPDQHIASRFGGWTEIEIEASPGFIIGFGQGRWIEDYSVAFRHKGDRCTLREAHR